jgi:hypothetical protein
MDARDKTRVAGQALAVAFLLLAACFFVELWGHPLSVRPVPLVDLSFIDTTPVRQSYADLKKAAADLSDFDCYACHENGKPPPLRFDTNQNIIIPPEHKNIIMAHGSHNRNNNCFNCHNDINLELLQARDGREVKFDESPRLCGSCHGPTYRDWEAGVHGRTSGFWNQGAAGFKRLDCVSCHDPHSPRFPGRRPAPGPHPLRWQYRL